MLKAALKEADFLARVFPHEGMKDEQNALQNLARLAEQGGSIDSSFIDRCLRRMRIAATKREYPLEWPDDLRR